MANNLDYICSKNHQVCWHKFRLCTRRPYFYTRQYLKQKKKKKSLVKDENLIKSETVFVAVSSLNLFPSMEISVEQSTNK